jgi:hypothetical protein
MFTKFPKLFSPDDGGSLLGGGGEGEGSLLGSNITTEEATKETTVETKTEEVVNPQSSSPENALEKEAEKQEPEKEKAKEPDKKEPEKKEEEKPAPKAPEKYDFKMPEGVTVNDSAMEKATAKFKELDLTQEQAQSLVDIQTELVKEQAKEYQNLFEKTKNDWKKQAIKELGANYKEELAYGAKFRDQFLSPETVAFLDENGLLSHPAIVKDFIKAGKMLAEDKLEAEGKKGSEQSLGSIFYPDMQKK